MVLSKSIQKRIDIMIEKEVAELTREYRRALMKVASSAMEKPSEDEKDLAIRILAVDYTYVDKFMQLFRKYYENLTRQ